MLERRRFTASLLATTGLATAGFAGGLAPLRPALAQTPPDGWPARPVRVIYPTGPGGPSDNFRLYADHLKAAFGQSFVGENMAGGSGAIGSTAVARAAADGYTLLVGSNSATVLAPLVFERHPINMKRDFVPVALLFNYRFLLVVNSELPVKSLAEFIAYAKAHQGELNYGSPGIGTGGHLVTSLLLKRAGIDAVHVPYQATTQQLLAAAGGHLHFTFDTVGNARGLVEGGKVRPLAVTGAGRATAMPDVPNFDELGFPGFSGLFVSTSMLAPAGTPPGIVAALNREMVRCQSQPDVKTRLEQGSYEPGLFSVEEMATFFDNDIKNWSQVVRETGVHIKA
jgi:tripartite-type tricarboxylate transporter receptor subunit TctC